MADRVEEILRLFDNHDARLPYYELMLEKDLVDVPEYELPKGYHFENYHPGDQDAWIRIEKSAKEFRTVEEGLDAWQRYFAGHEKELENRMFFVVRDDGLKVATATDFYNIHIGDDGVNGWLHWVAVCREAQGHGLSKPLISRVLQHMRASGYRRAVIPTQTTTWLACKVYLDLGFHPIPKNAERNRAGWEIIRGMTHHPILEKFAEADVMQYDTTTTVIFVRHAQAVYNEDDRNRPLSKDGLQDSKIVLETLRNRHILVFASSPYQRSIQTILETSCFFDMPIQTDERFRERKCGNYDPAMLKKRWADFSFAEEGGECLQSVQDRNVAALQDLLHEHAGKTIVIGTHGTALSTILNYFDKTFDVNDFLRIVSWMPYIIELTFIGDRLIAKRELAHVEKVPEKILVCGLNGVGKSTFGKALAARLGYHYLDTEDYFFPCRTVADPYRDPHPHDEVVQLLRKDLQRFDNVVLSSVNGDYGREVEELLTTAVEIRVPAEIRDQRLRDRSFSMFGTRMQSGGDLYEAEEAFFAIAAQRDETLVTDWLDRNEIRVISIDGTRPITENLEHVLQKLQGYIDV